MNNSPTLWPDLTEPHLTAINLELTARCNEKCSFCPNSRVDFRAKGDIDLQLIKKMTEELSPDVSIAVCGIGEPSLHPRFEEAMEILCAHFRRISVVSNGYLFRNKRLRSSVLTPNVEKVSISLDYIDPQQYYFVKQARLDRILTYLDAYIALANQSEYSPTLQINFLYDPIKKREDYIKVYEYFATRKIVGKWCIYVRKIKSWARQVDIEEESDENLDYVFRDYVNANFVVENWSRYLSHTICNSNSEWPNTCRHIFKYYMLLWNGDVVPCCIDAKGTMPIGNAWAKGFNFHDIFYAKEYVEFRRKLELKDFASYPLCKSCNDYYKCV